ncbi:MAG TPA: HEAT repeat domain-containing protein, partial [Planctomycetota bacterium]|nr:HEAT repeat domain-containing protein [Planctomycetota bacterium]
LRPLLIEAISNRGTVAAVEVLTHLLGKDGELDLLLMTAIGKSAATVAPPFGKDIEEAVRSMLSADSADLVRETALVVGRLEDAEAIQALVPLLGHANRGVRQNAYWSLKRISGLSFAADQKTWAAWLKVEEVWWRDTAPELFDRLETAERPEALDIVQQIARRRYPRHPLAVELARGLSHGDCEVRRLTCIALAQFRSRTAVAGLLVCLDDASPEVRTEAGRALRAVTGLDLPPVRTEWDRAGY